MSSKNKTYRVALAVENFLPVSQVWIWRQMNVEGLEPTLILTKEVSNSTLFKHGKVVIGVNANHFLKRVKKKLWFFFKFLQPRLNTETRQRYRKALEENKIELVHAHFGTVASELIDVCKELNLPLVVTFHGFDATAVPFRWPGYKRKLKDVFHYSSKVVAISNFLSRKLVKLDCPPEKIFVNYLGVPLDEFRMVNRTNRTGRIRFLHLGRLVEKKGVPDVVRSFVSAFPREAMVELVIIGSGEDTRLIQELIQELAPVNPIVCKESVLPDRVKGELEEADVFVLNSRTDSQGTTEGLPIGLLEAMATGLPIISTLHAGIPEAIDNKVTGILVAERDNAALEMAMTECCDREHNQRLGEQARHRVGSVFSLEVNGKKLKELYQHILN